MKVNEVVVKAFKEHGLHKVNLTAAVSNSIFEDIIQNLKTVRTEQFIGEENLAALNNFLKILNLDLKDDKIYKKIMVSALPL